MKEGKEFRQKLRVPKDALQINLPEEANELAKRLNQDTASSEWREIPTTKVQPNAGWQVGWMGLAIGAALFLVQVVIGLITRQGIVEPGSMMSTSLFFLILSAFILLFSARRERSLELSAKALRISGEDGVEEFLPSQVASVETRLDNRLFMVLKNGREVTLPGLSRTAGCPPPAELVSTWFISHRVPVLPPNASVQQLEESPIPLPDYHKPLRWLKWWFAMVIPLISAFMFAPSLLMRLDPGGNTELLNSWSRMAQNAVIGIGVLLLGYTISARRLFSRVSLEYLDNGVQVITKGKTEPEVDPASFRRFLIEYRRCWWGQTLKRLCVETHYGRRIPLTQFTMQWQLEAFQILYQAAKRGIPVVLRMQGDEEPLEIQ